MSIVNSLLQVHAEKTVAMGGCFIGLVMAAFKLDGEDKIKIANSSPSKSGGSVEINVEGRWMLFDYVDKGRVVSFVHVPVLG